MKKLNKIKTKLCEKRISFKSENQYFYCEEEDYLYSLEVWNLYNPNYSINDALDDEYVVSVVPKFDI